MSSARTDVGKWVLYSTCDEDSLSELEALAIKPDDTVLSVTGSGCRTLSLMTRHPRRLISVDYSAGQNNLLELKLAAIRTLDYVDLLRFLGVHPCADRERLYAALQGRLSPEARTYFAHYRDRIRMGVLYAGRHEQFYVRFVAPLVKLLYGRPLRQIFDCDDLQTQWQLYERHICGPLWRLLITRGFSLPLIKLILNDAQYHIEVNVSSPGDYMLSRFEHTFKYHLAKTNDWLSMMLRGRYYDCLPHFLWPQNVELIRTAGSELEIRTQNIIECCRSLPAGSFDKFSLSDVTSCISRTEYEQLLCEVARIGVPNGKVCIRNFLANHAIPPQLSSVLCRDEALSQRLQHTDRAFAYSFDVATIEPAGGLTHELSH